MRSTVSVSGFVSGSTSSIYTIERRHQSAVLVFRPMLPKGHQRHIAQGVKRAWILYGVVLFGVVLELGMGMYVHQQLGLRGVRWNQGAVIWTVSLAILATAEAVAGLWVRRWLIRPATLLRRLRASLDQEGLGERISLELLTVVAVRAVLLADVVAWILLQFITIYGLILVVITGRLWLLMTFAVASVVLLTRAVPSRARIGRLIEELRGLG